MVIKLQIFTTKKFLRRILIMFLAVISLEVFLKECKCILKSD